MVRAAPAISQFLPVVFCWLCLHAPAWAFPEEAKPEADKSKAIRPYDEVITKEARSDPGLFIVHRLASRLFFEIRPEALGKDMLWVTQLAETQAGFSYAGMPVLDRVVRWEVREESVLLRDVAYSIRAEVKDPIRLAVEATSVAPIIRVFPIKAWGKDRAPVLDVTELYTTDVQEFSARASLGVAGLDAGRTFLDEVKSFPENIEVKVLATYGLAGNQPGRDPTQGAVTVLLHHSMVKLPETPMSPRRLDERVGFFSVGFSDFGDDRRHQAEEVRYITRWRLEKKDPQAAVSEPRKPIVFYVGREVPEKWKPYVKKGIEAWQPAFESAGFKGAIIARDAPSPHEDPDWDAEDARISTIRWLPASIKNAFGPHVHDPRTGEILEADIRMYHDVLKLVRDWYFVQASPCDPRAQRLPMPDDLMGELLAYVVTHEVGHSLGFPHNMKASSSFTVEQLRDPAFTRKYGTTASIMDYARFNYVAQPGDGAALLPVVSKYDFFAVEWGYREFAGGDDERRKLEDVVKRQVADPALLFGDLDPFEDPTRQREDLGSDPVSATALGEKNILRVAAYLVEATCKPGEDYSLLRNMYDELLGQWSRELGHVVSLVGGIEERRLRYGDASSTYYPVPAARQRAALSFLAEHAFRAPRELVDPAVTSRLEAHGAAQRILSVQRDLLGSLLAAPRLERMLELSERFPAEGPYGALDLFSDLRAGIWGGASVVAGPPPDLYARNLQRAHFEILASLMEEGRSMDIGALVRSELGALLAGLRRIGPARDPVVEAHRQDMETRILRVLDPTGAGSRSGRSARL